MGDGENLEPRRRILQLAGCGSAIGLAGCVGTAEEEYGPPDREFDWCYEDLEGPVPEEEAEAESIDEIERKDPEDLLSKEEIGYQCNPVGGEQCGNCTFYIDDKTGDAIGACTEVEGNVRSADWCEIWAPRQKMGES